MAVNRSLKPWVYFVRRADGEGPIKIGCSQRPEDRLSSFMQWSPYRLAIIARLEGDEGLERRFHAKFAAQHSHREWFHPTPELEAVVRQISAGEFDIETLPAARGLTYPRRRTPWPENSRLSASWSRRLYWIERRGIKVPREVVYAARRFNAGPYAPDYNPGLPEDRAKVEAFLAQHPAPRRRAA